MIVICIRCGQTSGCLLAGGLHAFTEHFHDNCHIPKELRDEEGIPCLTCLLANMVPISDYYRLKKEGKND